ncbi:hypothetical protein AB9F45_37245, partial [Rhizobium leguminosarum]|uniref:hypothetical protein n=1 Tax=Rhizobium leguminosarum TaxID=384 RepID=UPI003F9DDAFC
RLCLAFEVLDVPEHDLRRYEADEADLDGALIAGAILDLLFDFMFKVLAGANFHFVCANLTKGQLASDPKQDDLFLKPYIIVEKQ